MQMLHISFKQITFSPTFESLKKWNFALLNYWQNLTVDCKYWSRHWIPGASWHYYTIKDNFYLRGSCMVHFYNLGIPLLWIAWIKNLTSFTCGSPMGGKGTVTQHFKTCCANIVRIKLSCCVFHVFHGGCWPIRAHVTSWHLISY